jgi:hypothetical protein
MGRGEMGNGKREMKISAWLPVFENYGKLSLTQNGTNYKFIKKNLEHKE